MISHHHRFKSVGATPSTTTPAPMDEDLTISADRVAAAFALQYFKVMKTHPEDLFRFYVKDSRVSRGTNRIDINGMEDIRNAIGPNRIRELLHKEHSCGPRLDLAIVKALVPYGAPGGTVTFGVGAMIQLMY